MTAASLHTIDRRGGPSGALRRLGLAVLAGFAALAAQAALAQVDQGHSRTPWIRNPDAGARGRRR